MDHRTRVGAILAPHPDWSSVEGSAAAADESGLDAIGLWDHYHSARPEWGYVAGWSAYGALAASTRRVRLVPMVLNSLHYELGVLAKETSILAALSHGRFELGIGAGDWPGSFDAWGSAYPDPQERVERLEETVRALRELWTGRPVTFDGRFIRLHGAISSPAPVTPPRVVVGVGKSVRTLRAAAAFADELNLYDDDAVVAEAHALVALSRRRIALSAFVDWSFANWPAQPRVELDRLAAKGFDRIFVSVGGPDMANRVRALGGDDAQSPDRE